MNFIYTGDEKVLMINIIVNNQNKAYNAWYEEKTNVDEIKDIIKTQKTLEQYEKEESFIKIKKYISFTFSIPIENILVKDIVKISSNEYSFTYVNIVTNEKFTIHAKFEVKTNSIIVIKHQEQVSASIQTI